MTLRIDIILALALAGSLAGCAVGPTYERITPEQAAPGQFNAAPAHAGMAHITERDAWWYGFQDAGLNALVQAALRQSPDIATAEANIRQARAGVTQAAGAQALQVSGTGRVGRDQISKEGENFANIPFPNPQTGFTDYRGGLDASWEIDLFGHTARTVESARARVGGMEAQREAVALSISAETARNVLDYRHLQLRIANARVAAADERELSGLVRLQRAAGMASDIEVTQAEVAVQNAEAALPPLEAAAQAAVAALIPLTGMPREAIAAQLGNASAGPVLPEARHFAVSSRVLERRPDIRAAERQLASATAEVGAAMADQYPRFTLVGDAGWESIHPGQFGRQASRYWNIGPQLYVPILNGGQVRAEIAQSRAAQDAALSGYRKAVLAALADTESAMLRCQGDHGRLARLDAAYSLQSGQIDLTQKRVDAGEAPRIDLLNTRIQREGLADQQLATRQALAEDLVLLYKALGGNAEE
ncbi:MAG TPA: efflux transporter outer membrane subunit [Burkholderiaceae bacterium]